MKLINLSGSNTAARRFLGITYSELQCTHTQPSRFPSQIPPNSKLPPSPNLGVFSASQRNEIPKKHTQQTLTLTHIPPSFKFKFKFKLILNILSHPSRTTKIPLLLLLPSHPIPKPSNYLTQPILLKVTLYIYPPSPPHSSSY